MSASPRSPVELGAGARPSRAGAEVQDAVHFTYDDHQAGTAMQEAPGQPNRVRAIRTATAQVRGLLRPATAGRRSEYELYDLERDPDEADNLLDVRTGEARSAGARELRDQLAGRLEEAMRAAGTNP